MTLFGIVWIVYLIFCSIQKGYNRILFALFLSMILQCDNVLVLNGSGIGPQIITSLFFIIIYLLKEGFKIRIKKDNMVAFMGTIILFIPILMTTNASNNLRVILLATYILDAYLLSTIKDKISESDLTHMLIVITWIVFFIGITQMLMTANILPSIWLYKTFIYNDVASAQFYLHIVRFYSTFQEASYCAPLLLGLFFYFIDTPLERQKKVIIISIISLSILLTFSSTAYVAFMISLALWSLTTNNRKVRNIIIPLSMIGSLFMLTFGYSILETVIFNKLSSGSGKTREIWNVKALEAFQTNMIWGVGYKTQRASSLAYTLLAELGLVGFAGYLLFNYGVIKKKGKKLLRRESLMVISCMLCSFIACPDVDLCSYWLIMYIVALLDRQGDLYCNERWWA